MVTNIPAPYREGIHAKMNERLGSDYHVFYCASTERNRHWIVENGSYFKTFLKPSVFGKRKFYLNMDIIRQLRHFDPDVVVTGGFSPTMLLCFLWCVLNCRKHVVYSDGTLISEQHLGRLHKIIRRLVYGRTSAFIGVSKKSLDLYRSYKVDEQALFLSPYCADNSKYLEVVGARKEFDLMFCGQLITRKMPDFFFDVVCQIRKVRKCRVLIVGDGELRPSFLEKLRAANIDFTYRGFLQADELPYAYATSRILLFPTQYDAWGVVSNEACAAGVPVITCAAAGAAHELVVDGFNGYILPLEPDLWAKHALELLSDSGKMRQFSVNAIQAVQRYDFNSAADGLSEAVRFALSKQLLSGRANKMDHIKHTD